MIITVDVSENIPYEGTTGFYENTLYFIEVDEVKSEEEIEELLKPYIDNSFEIEEIKIPKKISKFIYKT
jgi:hypothetical protein